MTTYEEKGKRIVGQVLAICDRAECGDGRARAAKAALRRALSPAMRNNALQYLAQWCDLTDEKGLTITASIAAFICIHPYHAANCGNFGATLRKLAFHRESTLENFDRHFQRIAITSTCSGLCDRVGRIIHMVHGTRIPVDYVQLYMDMFKWDKKMVLRWAKGYYGAMDEEDQDVAE